jgi:3-hydroxyisobutyrate dehydrogenase
MRPTRKPTIGFIGLGLMGAPMAERILTAGYPLVVHNRTREKAKPLLTKGARWCDSPRVLGEECSTIFSMVSTPDALSEISLGPRGLLKGLRNAGVHVDMSTVSPTLTQRFARLYKTRGSSFLHSPVLGSIPQAAEGSLLLFVGGDAAAYRRVKPIMSLLGRHIWRFKRAEEATHTKLLCNMFIAGMITTLVQAFVYARKAQVDPATLLDILGHSALNAPMYQTKGRAIIEGRFTPRFFVEHMLKDIELILESASGLKVPLPTLQASLRLFRQAMEDGYAREDYAAIIKSLQNMTAS